MSSRFNKAIAGNVASLAKLATGLGAAATAVSTLNAVVIESSEVFREYEKGILEVSTLIPSIGIKHLERLSSELDKFAGDYVRTLADTTNAAYQAISAQVPPNNLIDFLSVSADAARGGVTSLTVAVDGLTSAVNAYGTDVLSAQQASDIMFTTVRLGKTIFPQLANEIGKVTPIAASLGVSFEEISAGIAAMTIQGINTAYSATYLRRLLDELADPTRQLGGEFYKIANESFVDFIARGNTLNDALNLIAQESKKTGREVATFAGTMQAAQAILLLTSTEGSTKFNAALRQMNDSMGATEEAASKMEQGLSYSLEQASVAFERLQNTLGEKFSGPLSGSVNTITSALNLLNNALDQDFISKQLEDLHYQLGDLYHKSFPEYEFRQQAFVAAARDLDEAFAKYGETIFTIDFATLNFGNTAKSIAEILKGYIEQANYLDYALRQGALSTVALALIQEKFQIPLIENREILEDSVGAMQDALTAATDLASGYETMSNNIFTLQDIHADVFGAMQDSEIAYGAAAAELNTVLEQRRQKMAEIYLSIKSYTEQLIPVLNILGGPEDYFGNLQGGAPSPYKNPLLLLDEISTTASTSRSSGPDIFVERLRDAYDVVKHDLRVLTFDLNTITAEGLRIQQAQWEQHLSSLVANGSSEAAKSLLVDFFRELDQEIELITLRIEKNEQQLADKFANSLIRANDKVIDSLRKLQDVQEDYYHETEKSMIQLQNAQLSTEAALITFTEKASRRNEISYLQAFNRQKIAELDLSKNTVKNVGKVEEELRIAQMAYADLVRNIESYYTDAFSSIKSKHQEMLEEMINNQVVHRLSNFGSLNQSHPPVLPPPSSPQFVGPTVYNNIYGDIITDVTNEDQRLAALINRAIKNNQVFVRN